MALKTTKVAPRSAMATEQTGPTTRCVLNRPRDQTFTHDRDRKNAAAVAHFHGGMARSLPPNQRAYFPHTHCTLLRRQHHPRSRPAFADPSSNSHGPDPGPRARPLNSEAEMMSMPTIPLSLAAFRLPARMPCVPAMPPFPLHEIRRSKVRSKTIAAPACSNPRHAPNPSSSANHWELEAHLRSERRALAHIHPRETTTTNPACTDTHHSPEHAKFFTLMGSHTFDLWLPLSYDILLASQLSCFVPCIS